MNPEVIAALSVAAGALLLKAAQFLKDSRISEVITSGSEREETAVAKMADLSEKTTSELLRMLGKALDTVAQQTGALQQIAMGLQGHEQDSSIRWAQDRDMSERILREIDSVKVSVADLERLVTDLALKILGTQNSENGRTIRNYSDRPQEAVSRED
jgi:hypothetical protein